MVGFLNTKASIESDSLKLLKAKNEVAQIHSFLTWNALVASKKSIPQEWQDEVTELYAEYISGDKTKDREIEALKGAIKNLLKTNAEEVETKRKHKFRYDSLYERGTGKKPKQ